MAKKAKKTRKVISGANGSRSDTQGKDRPGTARARMGSNSA